MSVFIGYRGRVVNGSLTTLATRHGSLRSESGIGTAQALAWLCTPLRASAGRYRVSYGFDLESNLILRDLPADHVGRLLDGETVAWSGYSIEWLPGMLLHVKPKNGPGVVIYDLAGWFRTDLGSAVDNLAGALPEMQRARNAGDSAPLGNAEKRDLSAELRHIGLLELLGERLLSGAGRLAHVGSLTRFYGPGALASKALASVGARLHLKKYTADRSRPELYNALSRAYFGGRVELLQLGGFPGGVWRYDLNSAYGYGLAQLAPVGYLWSRVGPERLADLDFSCWRVRWSVQDRKRDLPGPLPVRNASGITTYPANGHGWYWSPEVRAAQRLYPDGEITVIEGWAHAAKRRSVVAELAESVYAERAAIRGADPMADTLSKLTLPAVYGKLAQRKGRAAWSCLPAAGLVTAHVRAALLDAARLNPAATIAFATDAIYSTAPLDLDIGGGLGQWRVEHFASGSFVQPGVYRLVNHDGTKHHKSRGFVATPDEFTAILAGLANPDGVVLSRPCFVGHALARLLPGLYAANLFHVVNLPYSVNPYRSHKRVYDLWQNSCQDYRLNPIADWTRESRRSWQVIGGHRLSARHDATGAAVQRAAVESNGARAAHLR